MQRAVHERLVFELLGIRERFSNSTTRKALDAYPESQAPASWGSQDKCPDAQGAREVRMPLLSLSTVQHLCPTWNGRGHVIWRTQAIAP